jgi:hypothetical protein
VSAAGYVELKHALSALALRAAEDPSERAVARALARCARAGGGPVTIADLAAAAGADDDAVRDGLRRTGLFDEQPAGRFCLKPAYAVHVRYLDRQTARLGEALRMLQEQPPAGLSAELRRGVALFNAGLFFECHEYFEDVWRASGGDGRAFYHGLIQAAAACYHAENGNRHGARVLADKAADKLRRYGTAVRGLDVAALVAALGRLRASAERGASAFAPSRGELPRMTLAGAAAAAEDG